MYVNMEAGAGFEADNLNLHSVWYPIFFNTVAFNTKHKYSM